MTKKNLIRKHYIFYHNGTAYCSKCGSQMIGDHNTVNTHKKNCGPFHFVPETIKSDDYLCLCEKTEDHLFMYIYKPELLYNSAHLFQEMKLKQIYKVQFGLKNKEVKEFHFIEDENVKNATLISLHNESLFEIIYDVFRIPFNNLKTFVEYYKNFYPVKKLIDDETAAKLLKNSLSLPDDYVPGPKGIIVGKFLRKENLLKISIFSWKFQEICRFLVGKNYFYTEDNINIRFLLCGKLPSLITYEDANYFEKVNTFFENLQYWNDYNLLLPLFAQFNPQMQWLLENKCYSILKHYYSIESSLEILINTMSLRMLQSLDNSCFQDQYISQTLLRIQKYAKEYLEVDKTTYIWLLFVTENVIASLKNHRTSIKNYAEMEPAVQRQVAEHIYNIQNQTDNTDEMLMLYLDYIEYLNKTLDNQSESFT